LNTVRQIAVDLLGRGVDFQVEVGKEKYIL